MRTSEVLRSILTKNPGVKRFSVARILSAIGSERVEASLVVFSLPAIVPVPAPNGIVAAPTGALGCQLMLGGRRITLPRKLLRQIVSRKSLAVAIHAILPVVEAIEKHLKPRWNWMLHSHARRAIGLLVFLLAVAIAYPLSGFNVLHGLSIFVLSLGMAEQDGLAVLIGVVAGVLSLALIAAAGVSACALRSHALTALRKHGPRLGRAACSSLLDHLGHSRLARVLSFEWSHLLLLWDPERSSELRIPAQACGA